MDEKLPRKNAGLEGDRRQRQSNIISELKTRTGDSWGGKKGHKLNVIRHRLAGEGPRNANEGIGKHAWKKVRKHHGG